MSRVMFHDDNCMKIWNVIIEYNLGNIDKEIALKELSKCDLNSLNTGTANNIIKDTIDQLYFVENKSKRKKKKTEEL